MPSSKTKESKKSQSNRFIEAAREADASEDEAVFDDNLKRLANAKPGKDERKDRT
jgi:hypothetical protein